MTKTGGELKSSTCYFNQSIFGEGNWKSVFNEYQKQAKVARKSEGRWMAFEDFHKSLKLSAILVTAIDLAFCFHRQPFFEFGEVGFVTTVFWASRGDEYHGIADSLDWMQEKIRSALASNDK